MSDQFHQDFNPAQSDKQVFPATIASAASITPTTRMTFITGTVQIANIVPPTSGYCEIILCFTNGAPGAFLTNGTQFPIKVAYQPIQNRPISLHWDPASKFWWPEAVV
jgi:hypothetical protein